MTLFHHLLTEACNNGWSNHRMLKACVGLTPRTCASLAGLTA